MGRTLALAAALVVFAVMAMGTGSMAQTQNKGTYVVKPVESAERTSCVAKCRSAAMKNKVYCDKETDPVQKAYCMKRLDAPYNYCVSKCPAK